MPVLMPRLNPVAGSEPSLSRGRVAPHSVVRLPDPIVPDPHREDPL